jgi:hypothetical protein
MQFSHLSYSVAFTVTTLQISTTVMENVETRCAYVVTNGRYKAVKSAYDGNLDNMED